MRAAAVIVAAGRGTRLGAGRPKAFVALGDRSVLARTVAAVGGAAGVEALVVVAAAEQIEEAEREARIGLDSGLPLRVVAGGTERQGSVRNGLAAVEEWEDLVVVHDAARPLVSPSLVSECLRVAAEKGAATAGIPLHDTIKEVAGTGVVERTLDRSRLWLVQTPQAFGTDLLRRAHQRAAKEGLVSTDDAALVERYGGRVWVVRGAASNRKITTAEDLAWAEWMVASGGAPR